jgi:hypothetical protein
LTLWISYALGQPRSESTCKHESYFGDMKAI